MSSAFGAPPSAVATANRERGECVRRLDKPLRLLTKAAHKPIAVGSKGGIPLARRSVGRVVMVRASAEEVDPMEQARQAAMSANSLPDGVSSEDLRKFYLVVDSKSWEEVQAKTMEMVQSGELTEGVVLAGEAVLSEAQNRQEDPRIIGSLQDAVGLLASALQIVDAPPSLRLSDECSNLMVEAGSVEAAEEKVQALLKEAFADSEVEVTPDSLLDDLDGFIKNIDEQEAQFQEMVVQVQQTSSDEEKAQLEEYTRQRQRARLHLLALQNITLKLKAT